MSHSTFIEGMLQIDHERGVIYFFSTTDMQTKVGYCVTPLSICGIGKIDYPLKDRQIDITITHNKVGIIK